MVDMFYRKKYREKENLEKLYLFTNTTTPERTYIRMRALYLIKCHRYPYNKAYGAARTEWNKLEERIIKEGF